MNDNDVRIWKYLIHMD